MDWLFVLGVVIIAFLIIKLILPAIFKGFWMVYGVVPGVWLLLVLFIRRQPHYKGVAKLSQKKFLIGLALGAAAFQIYLFFVAGFFEKIGKSPYSFTLKGILLNIIFVGSSLLAMETSRAWLINRLARKPQNLLPIIVACGYAYIMLSQKNTPLWYDDLQSMTQFFGSSILPVLMENLLASYLALWGGVLPAISYRGVLQAYEWFCPILPELNWAMKALTGTVVPLVALAVLQSMMWKKFNPARARRGNSDSLVSYAIQCSVAVVVIWFTVGVFPVHPTVIISGSMRPSIDVGDIVIVAKQDIKLLKIGDIIQFNTEDRGIPTIHRIVEASTEDNVPVFITKGDANNVNDAPVKQGQITGKVIFVIPKAGWVTIAARELFT